MDPEIDVGTNALNPEAAPPVEAVIETPVEAVVDPAPEPEVAPEPEKQHGNKGKPAWWQERINEETNRRRQIEAQLEQERREKLETRALLERLQGGEKEAPKARTEETDIDALVEARAAQKLFNDDCNAVAEAGAKDIPDFNDKLGLLRSIGVVSDDFLKDIFAVDKASAHKMLDRLAQEPDRAHMMTRMDSRRRIAELTRMQIQMAEAPKPAPAPAAKTISKVPPPKPVVDAVGDDLGEMDLSNDKLSDADWSKLWNKRYLNKKSA